MDASYSGVLCPNKPCFPFIASGHGILAQQQNSFYKTDI